MSLISSVVFISVSHFLFAFFPPTLYRTSFLSFAFKGNIFHGSEFAETLRQEKWQRDAMQKQHQLTEKRRKAETEGMRERLNVNTIKSFLFGGCC
jgi:hypothetical protein